MRGRQGIAMLHRDQQLLTGQNEILLMIAREASAAETLAAIVRLAEVLEPAAIGGVTIVDRAGQALEMAVFPSLHHSFADAIAGAPLGPPYVGTCAQALHRGEAVTSEDLRSDTRFAKEWLQLCADHGIRACRSHAVRNAEGAPLGAFMLSFREPRKQDSFDNALIAQCATLIELTLERRRVALRRDLILGEFQHRARNLLSTVGALAHFSYEQSSGLSGFLEVFNGRLDALAAAHELLLSESGISLNLLLEKVLAPYQSGQRIELFGSIVQLGARAVAPLSLTIHELATNAVKYGALSNDKGRVKVAWDLRGERGAEILVLNWTEGGGPPVKPPTRRGFGMRAIEQMLASEIDGRAALAFERDGLHCTIEAPVAGLTPLHPN